MQNEIIDSIVEKLKIKFEKESTGHDWFHIERVWKVAKEIGLKEGGDLFTIELGALFHDIADHKFVENADEEAVRLIDEYLKDFEIPASIVENVKHIVLNCSFKGGVGANKMKLKEGLIVQDADRIDALGAIGIARTFAFGGKYGNLLYHPDVKPNTFKSAEEYRNKRTHTINHFYEKLLLLKDKMNTKTGREIADQRHVFMESFLEQFYHEWNMDF